MAHVEMEGFDQDLKAKLATILAREVIGDTTALQTSSPPSASPSPRPTAFANQGQPQATTATPSSATPKPSIFANQTQPKPPTTTSPVPAPRRQPRYQTEPPR